MIDHDIPAIYNRLAFHEGDQIVVSSEISMADVYRIQGLSTDMIDFKFETVFVPYQAYSIDGIPGIDLVICSAEGEYLTPLEVKLTVLPTSSTSMMPESQWGCELVVRSATTSYCAIGMYDASKHYASEIREMFEDTCSSIGSWDNNYEMSHMTPNLSKHLDQYQARFHEYQKPLSGTTAVTAAIRLRRPRSSPVRQTGTPRSYPE
jgi:hypothetical protein